MLPVDIRDAETPRDRLLAHGAKFLSDAELLSLLLSNGRRRDTALEVAHRLLASSGGLTGFVGTELSRFHDLGLSSAAGTRILAALEIGCRLARAEVPERTPLARPAAVARYLSLRHRVDGQEVMGAMYLDTRNRLLSESMIFQGTINRAAADPSTILRRALQVGAAALIVFHTHPSGDPTPSAEDFAFTRRLREASELVGIKLVDHLILAMGDKWKSLAEIGF